jgi:hypothetical protein
LLCSSENPWHSQQKAIWKKIWSSKIEEWVSKENRVWGREVSWSFF